MEESLGEKLDRMGKECVVLEKEGIGGGHLEHASLFAREKQGSKIYAGASDIRRMSSKKGCGRKTSSSEF